MQIKRLSFAALSLMALLLTTFDTSTAHATAVSFAPNTVGTFTTGPGFLITSVTFDGVNQRLLIGIDETSSGTMYTGTCTATDGKFDSEFSYVQMPMSVTGFEHAMALAISAQLAKRPVRFFIEATCGAKIQPVTKWITVL